MKKTLSFLIFISLLGMVVAQQPKDCYSTPRNNGIQAYNQGNYSAAKKYFNVAKGCPNKPAHTDIDSWLKKCDQAMAAVKSSQTTEVVVMEDPVELECPTPQEEGKISCTDVSARTICFEDRRGLEVTVEFAVENMKGMSIETYCNVWPEKARRGGIIDAYKGTQFDVNGISGCRGRVIPIEQAYEHVEQTYFVPYAAMTLDSYEKQGFETMIVAYKSEKSPDVQRMLRKEREKANRSYEMDDGSVMSTLQNIEYMPRLDTVKMDKFITSPVSLTVDDGIEDKTIPFKAAGGSTTLDIATCGGGYEWSNVPSWIHASKTKLVVDENKSSLQREATLTVSPIGGGNQVRINIRQLGTPKKGPLATINKVSVPYNVSTQTDGQLVIHVNLDVEGCKDKTVKVCAFFYNYNGTGLLDANRDWIYACGYGVPKTDNDNFSDFRFRINSEDFMAASNLLKKEAKIYVRVSLDNGKSYVTESGPYPIIW